MGRMPVRILGLAPGATSKCRRVLGFDSVAVCVMTSVGSMGWVIRQQTKIPIPHVWFAWDRDERGSRCHPVSALTVIPATAETYTPQLNFGCLTYPTPATANTSSDGSP